MRFDTTTSLFLSLCFSISLAQPFLSNREHSNSLLSEDTKLRREQTSTNVLTPTQIAPKLLPRAPIPSPPPSSLPEVLNPLPGQMGYTTSDKVIDVEVPSGWNPFFVWTTTDLSSFSYPIIPQGQPPNALPPKTSPMTKNCVLIAIVGNSEDERQSMKRIMEKGGFKPSKGYILLPRFLPQGPPRRTTSFYAKRSLVGAVVNYNIL